MKVTEDWRDIGPTTNAEYRRRLAGTALEPFADRCYRAAGPHSAVLLAAAEWEQKYWDEDLSSIPNAFNNPLSLAKPEGGEGDDRWAEFPSPVECFAEALRRITSATYKAGIYARTGSLGDLIRVWAPSFENDTARVIAEAEAAIGSMPAAKKGSNVAPKLNMTKGLIPGPKATIQIATKKVNGVGMDLLGPRTYEGDVLHRALSGQGGVWSVVDWLSRDYVQGLTDRVVDCNTGEMVIINSINGTAQDMSGWANGPFNRGWASGDGIAFVDRYGGADGANIINVNLRSTEVSGDYDTAVAEVCFAQLVLLLASGAHDRGVTYDRYPLGPDGLTSIYGHREFCGTQVKVCPGSVVWEWLNGEAVTRVGDKLRAAQTGSSTSVPGSPTTPTEPEPPVEVPTYAKPVIPAFLADPTPDPVVDYDGTKVFLVTDQYLTRVATPRFRRALEDRSPENLIGPDIPAGEDVNVSYVFTTVDGVAWGLTPYGTRVLLRDLDRVSDAPLKA